MVLVRFLVLAVFSLLIGAFVTLNARDACAQSAACDPDFETVLNARSTLEAMREVEIAQRLILRPDSVLEYSCFDDRLNEIAASADQMFSDNVFSRDMFNVPPTHYNPSGTYAAFLPTINAASVTTPGSVLGTNLTGPNPPPAPPGRLLNSGLNNALSNAVYATMYQYLLSNFSQVYAADTFPGSTSAVGVCDPMNAVWEFIKCTDFDRGSFRTLGQMALGDPRVDAIPCNDPNRSSRWSSALTAAYPDPGAAGGVDTLFQHASGTTFNVYIRYLRESNSSACGAVVPIPTGVRVYQVPSGGGVPTDAHADFVCAPAGCFYDGVAGRCDDAP